MKHVSTITRMPSRAEETELDPTAMLQLFSDIMSFFFTITSTLQTAFSGVMQAATTLKSALNEDN